MRDHLVSGVKAGGRVKALEGRRRERRGRGEGPATGRFPAGESRPVGRGGGFKCLGSKLPYLADGPPTPPNNRAPPERRWARPLAARKKIFPFERAGAKMRPGGSGFGGGITRNRGGNGGQTPGTVPRSRPVGPAGTGPATSWPVRSQTLPGRSSRAPERPVVQFSQRDQLA